MNQDHLAAWQEVAVSLNQKLQESRATAKAQAQLAEDRRVALDDAMRLPVDGFFQNGNVSDELRNVLGQGIDQTGRKLAQQAFRQRDRGMNAILFVADAHADDQRTGKCKCTKPTTRCAEYRAIESELNSAYRWEMDQIKRMDKGLDHGLRRDHPAAKAWLDRHPHDL